MTDEEVLEVLKARIEALDPSIGRVYTTLRNKFDPEEIADELRFKNPDKGELIQFYVIRPDDGEEVPHSVGRIGHSLADQNYIITGFISVKKPPKGDTETVLNGDFRRIRGTLRTLTRLKPGADPDETANRRIVRWTGIDRVFIGETLCHFKSLTLTIQQRILSA